MRSNLHQQQVTQTAVNGGSGSGVQGNGVPSQFSSGGGLGISSYKGQLSSDSNVGIIPGSKSVQSELASQYSTKITEGVSSKMINHIGSSVPITSGSSENFSSTQYHSQSADHTTSHQGKESNTASLHYNNSFKTTSTKLHSDVNSTAPSGSTSTIGTDTAINHNPIPSQSQQIGTTGSGNKSKRPQAETDKYNLNNCKTSGEGGGTSSGLSALQNAGDQATTPMSGEDTTTSNSKKPQFQFVSMEPIKDQRAIQHAKVTNQGGGLNKNGEKNSAQLIEPATLSRILRLQKQTQYYLKSQQSGTGHSNSSNNYYYGNSPSKLTGTSYYDRDNLHGYYGGSAGQQQNRQGIIKLDIDKIGISGIPSLWVSRDELITGGHLYREALEEHERLERFLRILHCHKRYENDKYYGGSIFKRGNQAVSGISSGGNGHHQGSSSQAHSSVQIGLGNAGPLGGYNNEYIWFSIENLAKLKISSHSAHKEDGISELQMQVFPHIKSFDQAEALTFKILQAEAKLVRLILESHGFQQTDNNDWNILWTCTSSIQKQYIYENLQEFQRVNHFLNSSELTRKDRLCYNVGKMQHKFGKDHFDFLPETYILPDEFPEFQKQFQIRAQQQLEQWEDAGGSSGGIKVQNRNLWIVKPSSSSQGKGIFMVDDISEVQLTESQVISRYIDNPLLINGLKFDLRLYVLVTNFDPLKIYVYNEGLVRFASEPYNLETIKSNVYAHLTNYSINKKSENFVQNKNLTERDFGNKWSLSALQAHLERLGVDMKSVWSRIYDAIIKSIISVEGQIVNSIKRVQNTSGGNIKSNCFDLFGFDIILDSDLKPWILEVNLSPSLAFDSPLDFHIKSNLIVDALNIVGIRKYNRRKEGANKHLPNGGQKPVKVLQGSTNNQNNIQLQQTINNGGTGGGLSSTINQSNNATQAELRKRLSAQSATQANLQSQSQLAKFDAIERNSIIFQNQNIDVSHMERLSKISAKHRELLREHLEEFCIMRQFTNIPGTTQAVMRSRKHNFTRIFPAPGTNAYDMYFANEQAQVGQTTSQQPQKQYNKILYRYLYDRNSELQDILNQIVRQNEFLMNESNRRASQTRLKNNDQNSSSQQKKDELAKSLEKNDHSSSVGVFDREDSKATESQGGAPDVATKSYYHSTIDPPQINARTQSKNDVVVTSIQAADISSNHFNQQPNQINLNQRLANHQVAHLHGHLQPRSQSSLAKNTSDPSGGPMIQDFDSNQLLGQVTNGGISSQTLQSSNLKSLNMNGVASSGTAAGGLSPMNHQEYKKRGVANNMMNSNDNQLSKYSESLIQGQNGNNPSSFNQYTPQKQTGSGTLAGAGASSVLQHVDHLSAAGRLQYSNAKSLHPEKTSKPFSSDSNNNTSSYRKGSAGLTGVSQGQTPVPNSMLGDGRIVVTGDDILIEYVRRIMNLIKQCQLHGIEITQPVIRKLELFICHKIWQPKDDKNKINGANGDSTTGSSGAITTSSSMNVNSNSLSSLPMWQRIEKRFIEMGDRKRRLFIKKYQATAAQQHPENRKNSDSLEKMFKAQEKQKSDIVKDFSSNELELMLMQSNKNNPIEVVTLLLSLNSNTIGGTPSTTSSLIYNSNSNQGSTGYGGVLTKLEADTTKGVPSKQTPSEDAAMHLQNEKSFDNQGSSLGNGGIGMIGIHRQGVNQFSGSQSKDLNNNRHIQNSIMGQIRQSNDNLKNSMIPTFAGIPQSSHSQKKDQVSSSTIDAPNIIGIKSGSSTYHTQSQTHSHNHNSLVGSNANLMSNFSKAGGTLTSNGGGVGSSQIGSIVVGGGQGNHLKNSTSKGKNQGSFDRSDIALQTGLALTQQQNKLGSILLNNQQAAQDKKIIFPQINNNNNNNNNLNGSNSITSKIY